MFAVDAKHLQKEFPTRGEPLRVLVDVDFRLASGESLAIVGPSGSGKSTLLYILGALDRPTAGEVRIHGHDPHALTGDDLAVFRRDQIGFVFQDHFLLPQLSCLENVVVPALAKGPVTDEELQRAKQLVERVGLADRQGHRPAELSGGERQRTALARALIHRPRLLLADEPTGNLDQKTARDIGDLLCQLQQEEQTTMIVVTHSQELADRFGRQARMEAGRL